MYQPPQEILDKYATVLVNFALGGGKGIKKGETVFLSVPECAKPMLLPLQRAVMKAGGNAIVHFIPDGTAKTYYELASDEQLAFFPANYLKARVDLIDHFLMILAEADKHELEGVPPAKIMAQQKSYKPYKEWRDEKENAGKLTWTLALYGTPQMAKEAGLSLKTYWQQIINACYLDEADPVKKWQWAFTEIDRIKDALNSLKIKTLHVKSEKIDLTVGIGPNRVWMGGSGRNIPSFEHFISPDWRLTNGHIELDMPLYRYGNLIEGIKLDFKDGKVITASATKGESVLKEMIAQENADKIGEFSLTDKRLSRINKFMAETLFDENFGGKQGNTHIALGAAYKDSYPSDPSKITKEQWQAMGYNESVVHTDVISTARRTVTATLEDGSKKVIYKNGQFLV